MRTTPLNVGHPQQADPSTSRVDRVQVVHGPGADDVSPSTLNQVGGHDAPATVFELGADTHQATGS